MNQTKQRVVRNRVIVSNRVGIRVRGATRFGALL